MRRQLVSAPVSPPTTRIPPGTIVVWPNATAPAGWLICDNSFYAQSAYPALFSAIGTTYGGSGSTFAVPSLHGRVPLGVSTSPSRPLGTTGGTTTHQLTAAECALRDHAHNYAEAYNATSGSSCNAASGAGSNFNQTTATESTSTNSANAANAHTNVQPYVIINFIIKT